jgi:FADH2 O2-dependent halogenase
LKQHGIATDRDPFDADDAAQHHLLGSGWMWMLRLNHDRTSIGYTAPLACPLDWSEYPSIKDLLRESGIIGPKGGLRRSGRLQRWYEPVIDSRRILLPTAATTIDPLHSTGIAHALAGVERIAGIVLESSPADLAERVAQYRRSVLEETRLLDRLVSTAYATIQDFPRFTAACMLYFAGAIACEERYQRGETPTHLWNADDSEFVALVDWACGALEDRASDPLDRIRDRLAPWNTAGLMDPASAGRYAYTATKRAS